MLFSKLILAGYFLTTSVFRLAANTITIVTSKKFRRDVPIWNSWSDDEAHSVPMKISIFPFRVRIHG